MRSCLVILATLSIVAVGAPVASVAEAPTVVAVGPASHTITNDHGSSVFDCSGNGTLTLAIDLTTRRFYGVMASAGCGTEVIGSPDRPCCPVTDGLQQRHTCHRLDSGAIDCSFTTSTINATILLGADGNLTYDLVDANTGFNETIRGDLTRT